MRHLAGPLGLAAVLTCAPVQAEEAPEADSRQIRYVQMEPGFVTNFGNGGDGRLGFIKADVSLQVASREAEVAVRYHHPALRNSLVLLLSRQDEATLASSSGRETLRQTALAELQDILQAEEGSPYIEDLLFTDFIVQR